MKKQLSLAMAGAMALSLVACGRRLRQQRSNLYR